VVAGDFDSAKIKPLIQQLFGSLARGAEVPHRAAEPQKLDHVIRETMIDKVQLPMIKMCWHSPAGFADGDAEMDLIAALLAQGRTAGSTSGWCSTTRRRWMSRRDRTARAGVDVRHRRDGQAG
jgi:predicted Zn-dependent peptidase